MTSPEPFQTGRTAAFFDLDGTLLRGESQFQFLWWCWRQGIAPRIRAVRVGMHYAAFLAGLTQNTEQLRRAGYKLFTGMPCEDLICHARIFCENELLKELNTPVVALLENHLNEGHLIVLVTSAISEIAAPVTDKLGFHHLIATRLMEKDGILTGDFAAPAVYGEGKRVLVESFCQNHGIDPKSSFAYADSYSDLPLLEFIGNPIVVNPSRKLAQISKTRNWPALLPSGNQICSRQLAFKTL